MGNRLSADTIQYAVTVDNPPSPDCSAVHRCAAYPAALVNDIPGIPWSSPWDIFQYRHRMSGFSKKSFVGSRLWIAKKQESRDDRPGKEVEWVTYGEASEMAVAFAKGIQHKALVPITHMEEEAYPPARKLRTLGVVSKNRPEWFITELAASVSSLSLVPLYDSLGEDALLHILTETRMETIAMSKDSFLILSKLLLKFQESPDESQRCFKCHLKFCIMFDRPNDQVNDIAAKLGFTLLYWKDLIECGRTDGKHEHLREQKAEDVGTLCYTSGTTGTPKGVIITAGNYSATVAAHQRCIMAHPGFRTDHSDIHISYLPLAHVFERLICANCMALGVRIACYSGDTQKLLDDMKVIRPTVFLSVPRLYMRINDRVFAGVQDKSSVAQFLFNTAINTKLNNLREKGIYHHAIWDALVFGKTRKLMGGNVKFMLVGGAPLESIVQERMSVLFCCPLLHGFGMTEMGASFICNPGERVAGHIGGVQPSLEFCLKSVPEMNYFADGSDAEIRGELLVRGPSVTPGYLLNPQATKEAISPDGWLNSGDIAVLLPGNSIKIIDRKKNIFKLAQGEYVAPDKIEAVYTRATLVGQIFVHGDSSKSQLVAVVVPDEEMVARWAQQQDKPFGSLAEVCQMDDFLLAVMKSMDEAAQDAELKGFEKVKKVRLCATPFTVDNKLLTPTLKMRRHEARQRFANDIDEMYAELAAAAPAP